MLGMLILNSAWLFTAVCGPEFTGCVRALYTDDALHRLANFYPCSLSVWLCECSAGTGCVKRSEVCEATQRNTTEPMWFFGRLVCVSLAHLARESARPVQPQRQGGC
ncbi:hypothetical protein QLX08_010468 [Tetragonisca angustula]|uniref:Secreted protein n=1 Tax=Tetragonisca angustula TaxID=166442 RepID=A0AAW0ZDC8_9HYME